MNEFLFRDNVPAPRLGLAGIAGVWAVTLVAAALFWEAATSSGLLPITAFSKPADVARWMFEWFRSGESATHIWFTARAVLAGYVIGVLLGAIVAYAFAFIPFVATVLEPYMALLNGIPKIVLAPIIALLFGLGITSKIATGALMVFFVAFFGVLTGLRNVDSLLVKNLKVLGASRLQMLTNLYVPGIFTWLMATLRTCVGFGLIGVIVAEFVASTQGVGHLISLGASIGRPDMMMGALITVTAMALLLDRGLALVEHRFRHWRIL